MGKGKAEVGTPKYLANAMKSKGLQRLKWYCQVCEKQMRDDNGFKCHMMSEAHLRQMLVVGEHAGKHINDYSQSFQREFIMLLSRRWGTKRVRANQVYQEYIADKNHIHMNATRWVTLTEFVKYLGRLGIVHVDESEKGWYIAWIDNSPKALARQSASMNKERQDMDDEQRQRKYIAEQIERATALAGTKPAAEPVASCSGSGSASASSDDERQNVKLSNATDEVDIAQEAPRAIQPISIGLLAKKETSPSEAQEVKKEESVTVPPVAIKINPLKKANPLKANALKSAAPSKTATDHKPAHSMSVVEQLAREDQERKRRMEERNGEGPSKRVRI